MMVTGSWVKLKTLLPISLSFVCGTLLGVLLCNTTSTGFLLSRSSSNCEQKEKNKNTKYSNNNEKDCDDVPENAPENCPGLESDQAGKASACAGCPNQDICASGAAKQPDPSLQEISLKMSNIKRKILVLSGKGGVGKSTVSAQMSWLLQERGFEVGILDTDVCGPSIPMLTGSRGMDVHASADGWSPVYPEDNLAVMSVGFLLPEENDAIIWRGPKKNGLIKQFLTDVSWGALDVLIVDTPPGTSDEHLSIVTYLKEAGIDGAILVSTPQEVALQDVRKEINFCKKVDIPILGLIENMTQSVFDATEAQNGPFINGAKKTCDRMEIPYIGALQMDPSLLHACETGVSLTRINPNAASRPSLIQIVDTILQKLNMPLMPNKLAAIDQGTEKGVFNVSTNMVPN